MNEKAIPSWPDQANRDACRRCADLAPHPFCDLRLTAIQNESIDAESERLELSRMS
jgi:hypothetical protein